MKKAASLIWNALLTATVVTMLAGLFVAAMPPVYQATATVKGEPDGMLVIQSGDLLDEVLKTTGANPEDLQGWLEQWSSSDPDGRTLLKQKLFVAAGEHEQWIDITVEAQVAATAASLANEIARAYLARIERNLLTPEVKAELFSAVEKADRDLAEFLNANPQALDFNSARATLNQRMVLLDRQLATATTGVETVRDLLDQARSRQPEGLKDQSVVQALAARNRHQVRLAQLGARYGTQHQKMGAAKAELAAAESILDQEIDQAAKRFSDQLQKLRSKEKEIKQQQQVVSESIVSLQKLQVQHKTLMQRRETAEDKFNGLTSDNRKYEFAEAVSSGNTLGFNQLILLGLVFAGVFVLIALLLALRGGGK